MNGQLARRYYRLGLVAAKERDLTNALRCADFARILDPQHEEAARLAEICRYELDGNMDEDQEPGRARIEYLAGQKNWKAAAKEAGNYPHQSVRLLALQGCLWALAKRYARAADCFARVLAQDRGNRLAAGALAELGRRRNYFWRFLCSLPT